MIRMMGNYDKNDGNNDTNDGNYDTNDWKLC